MCEGIYRDKQGKNHLPGKLACHVLELSKSPSSLQELTEGSLGHRINVLFDETSLNARWENLPTAWTPKGMVWVQTDDKIQSFLVNGKLIYVEPNLDILCIAVLYQSNFWLKVVTREDGVTYFSNYREYPPFVTPSGAIFEHRIHHRWPVYRHRVIA